MEEKPANRPLCKSGIYTCRVYDKIISFFTFTKTSTMKPYRLSLVIPIVLLISICHSAIAQDLQNPGDYITAITKARGDMDNKYMQYLSAAAHGRRARKVEKLRLEVLD